MHGAGECRGTAAPEATKCSGLLIVMVAALITVKRAMPASDDDRHPTDAPQPQGCKGQEEMYTVINPFPPENLSMPTAGTVCANAFRAH